MRAEEQFALHQKQNKRVLEEKNQVQSVKSARKAKLRGLRLARDASDKEAADRTAAEKTSPSPASARKS